jgi:hypothetical protein
MGFGIGSIVNKAKDIGGGVVNKAKDVGGSVVDKARDVGGSVVDTASDVGGDVVHLSSEALEFKNRQEKNFASGVLDWGKGTVGTVVTLASHPIASAKAVGKLASNPVLNPVGGTALALAQGKNPVKAYKDGLGDVKEIGSGLLDGYKKTYKEHGAAGLAGSIAPDVILAVATGGTSTAVEGAGEAGGKVVASAVARDVAKSTAKSVAKKLAPGPEDVVNGSLDHNEVEPNFLEAFINNFSID